MAQWLLSVVGTYHAMRVRAGDQMLLAGRGTGKKSSPDERRHRRDVVLEDQGGSVPARRRDLAQDAEVAELVSQRGVKLLRRELADAARSVRFPVRQ